MIVYYILLERYASEKWIKWIKCDVSITKHGFSTTKFKKKPPNFKLTYHNMYIQVGVIVLK